MDTYLPPSLPTFPCETPTISEVPGLYTGVTWNPPFEFLYTHEFIYVSHTHLDESRTPFVKKNPSLPEAAYIRACKHHCFWE
jgi:hypothetical protein